jgi:hypothetical protein
MPLDNNLNKDLHDDVDRQVAATRSLEEDDEDKLVCQHQIEQQALT